MGEVKEERGNREDCIWYRGRVEGRGKLELQREEKILGGNRQRWGSCEAKGREGEVTR
jgi:hypothetical protein